MEQTKSTSSWSILGIGIVLGFFVIIAFVSYGLYSHFTKLKYAASASFQVKPLVNASIPPPTTTPTTTQPSPGFTQEDLELTIQRQIQLVRSDRVLDSVLRDSEAFKHFRTENPDSPKTALRKRLEVARIPNTDLFQITMHGNDREEVAHQANAIAETYYEELRQMEAAQNNTALIDSLNAQKLLERKVQEMSDGLEEFKKTHRVVVISQAYQIRMNTLAEITKELIKSETEASAAKANLENVTKQIETGKLQLTKADEQAVEKDPSLRALAAAKGELEQELADNVQKNGPQHKMSIAIQTRIDETQKQIDEMRSDKRNKARILMQENATSQLNVAQAKEKDLLARRDSLDRELKDLNKWIIEYKNRSSPDDLDKGVAEYKTRSLQLESQQKLLAELTREVTLKQLANRRDVQQVVRFSIATIPEK